MHSINLVAVFSRVNVHPLTDHPSMVMLAVRGPERSLQSILRPLIDIDRVLQCAYKIKYDIDDLEDSLEDLPMQNQAFNVSASRHIISTLIAALEVEKLQCLLRLRDELQQHRNVYGRIPAIGLR